MRDVKLELSREDVLGLKSGDTAARRKVYDIYRERIFHICMGITGDASLAADAAQEAFIKMYMKIGALREVSNFYTWFCRLAINTSLDMKRKRKREHYLQYDDAMQMDAVSVPKGLEEKELAIRVRSEINGLPKVFRAALVLRELEGLSYKEISSVLGCSIGSVRSKISRARERLRRVLSGYKEGR